jgi:hypothetical protein
MTSNNTTDQQQADDHAIQILSNEGAQCGDCGDQPGDRICPDCERCRRWYVAALRKAGWAPISEAADVVDAKLSAEPDHNRASALYEVLLQLRGELRCTCARSGGLHEKGCRKYVPGHELLSPVNALAAYRAEAVSRPSV